MSGLTVGDLEAAGVYDPGAPDATERLNALRLVEARGATLSDIVAAHRENRLTRLAAELLFLPRAPTRLTLDEVAQRAGVTAEQARAIWRGSGFPDVAPDDRRFSDAEVRMVQAITAGAALFGEAAAMQLLRVVGSSMARIADATVSTFVTTIGAEAIAADPTTNALSDANEAAAAMMPQLVDALDTLLRQHLVHVARPNISGVATSGYELMDMAVGFVDIVDSAALAQQLSLDEVGRTVARFEAIASDRVLDHGGRVVKFIGDEVMFCAATPADGCRIALDVVEAFPVGGELPGVRAGLAFGEAMVRDADCFGPIVNLAARVTKFARPGSVVVSDAVAVAPAEDLVFTALAPARLKGFVEPVALFEATRRDQRAT